MYLVSEERFEEMVTDALDKIPDEFVHRMRNLAILVEDYNEDNPHLLGLYVGVALLNALSTTRVFCPIPSLSIAAPCSTGATAKKSSRMKSK